MKVNGRPLPNNQKQAYMPGKLHGTQDTMGNVAMVPKDECGVALKASYFRLAAENCAQAERIAEFGSQATDGISLFDMMGEAT